MERRCVFRLLLGFVTWMVVMLIFAMNPSPSFAANIVDEWPVIAVEHMEFQSGETEENENPEDDSTDEYQNENLGTLIEPTYDEELGLCTDSYLADSRVYPVQNFMITSVRGRNLNSYSYSWSISSVHCDEAGKTEVVKAVTDENGDTVDSRKNRNNLYLKYVGVGTAMIKYSVKNSKGTIIASGAFSLCVDSYKVWKFTRKTTSGTSTVDKVSVDLDKYSDIDEYAIQYCGSNPQNNLSYSWSGKTIDGLPFTPGMEEDEEDFEEDEEDFEEDEEDFEEDEEDFEDDDEDSEDDEEDAPNFSNACFVKDRSGKVQITAPQSRISYIKYLSGGVAQITCDVYNSSDEIIGEATFKLKIIPQKKDRWNVYLQEEDGSKHPIEENSIIDLEEYFEGKLVVEQPERVQEKLTHSWQIEKKSEDQSKEPVIFKESYSSFARGNSVKLVAKNLGSTNILINAAAHGLDDFIPIFQFKIRVISLPLNCRLTVNFTPSNETFYLKMKKKNSWMSVCYPTQNDGVILVEPLTAGIYDYEVELNAGQCERYWPLKGSIIIKAGQNQLDLKLETKGAEVAFNSNGHGKAPSYIHGEKGFVPTLPCMEDVDGYQFAGWYSDRECTRKWSNKRKVYGEVKLYAKWIKIDLCNVYLDLGGINLAEAESNNSLFMTLHVGQKIPKPNSLQRKHYDVIWCVDKTKKKAWDFNRKIRKDTTLYAKWVPDQYMKNQIFKTSTLLVNASLKSKKCIQLTWNKVPYAEKYEVYAGKCNTKGKKFKMKMVRALTSKSFKYKVKNTGRDHAVHLYVRAVRRISGKTCYVKSNDLHIIPKPGKHKKIANPTSIKSGQRNFVLKVGEFVRFKVKVKVPKKTNVLNHGSCLSYRSSNRQIARVDAQGVIKAIQPGECLIYAIGTNGKRVTRKVTVSGKKCVEHANLQLHEITSITLDQTSYTYSGKEIRPHVTVMSGDQILDDNEYDVEYEDNLDVGKAKIRVTAKGNYRGEKESEFSIQAATLSELNVIESEIGYDGTTRNARFEVWGNQEKLDENDYEVHYSNNTDVGQATIEVTGIGNFKGELIGHFLILPQKISTVNLNSGEYTYNGSSIQPVVTVFAGKDEIDAKNYLVSYQNNLNRGTATVVVKGIGNYQGEISKTFQILPASLPGIKLGNSKYTYDGKSKKPTLSVKFGTKRLVEGEDYTVRYINNTNIGKASVKVSGIGNFTGNRVVSFYINPKGTKLVSLTPGSKSITVKWSKMSSQTSGYQIRYSRSKSYKSGVKIITIKSNSTVTKKLTSLSAKKRYYVSIRTYKNVGNSKYCSDWSRSKSAVTKS